jgi:HlyD family secretion protein
MRLADFISTLFRWVKLLFNRIKKGEGPIHPANFSPGLLRIETTPPHPLPRTILAVTVFVFTSLLIWAGFSHLDIVAVAHGKLVPTTYVKIVQPAEAGLVQEILVYEGERVKAGQVLMRMDSTNVTADLDSTNFEYQFNQLSLRRVDAEINDDLLEKKVTEPFDVFNKVLAQFNANRNSLEGAILEEMASLERAKHEIKIARATKRKLKKLLPYYREQEQAYFKLIKKGLSSKLQVSEKSKERIEVEEDLKAQINIIAREQAAMKQSEQKIKQIHSEYIRHLHTERAEVVGKISKLKNEISKQDHRSALMKLKAPQDGFVTDLATHTVGTVTQPGTILMTLVPTSEPVRAEVWLSNKDVGFVQPGQKVKIKLISFQFQKYGMLDGVIKHVAADAANKEQNISGDELHSFTYKTFVSLEKQNLMVDGYSYDLIPGMQVAAEIKLGSRTVLEYLLSPVRKAFHDAGRER